LTIRHEFTASRLFQGGRNVLLFRDNKELRKKSDFYHTIFCVALQSGFIHHEPKTRSPKMQRRTFLNRTAACGAAVLAGSQVMTVPFAGPAWSASLDPEATLIASLFPGHTPQRSDEVKIDAPYVTARQLGFVVKVSAQYRPLEAVAVMVSGDPMPLAHAARFNRPARYFHGSMTLQRTADVNAYVLCDDQLLVNSLHIKVTRGGYGTNTF
jgi:predicted secreted protein